MELQQGILDKYNVELIGAKLPSIDKAEDRELFKQVWMCFKLRIFPLLATLLLTIIVNVYMSTQLQEFKNSWYWYNGKCIAERRTLHIDEELLHLCRP